VEAETDTASSAVARRDEVPTAHVPVARATQLIERLERAYQNGDLRAFIALFAQNAQVNEGRGVDFIRTDYAKFFARIAERRLDIHELRWQTAAGGGLIGKAEVRVAIRERGASHWRHLSGVMELEIVKAHEGLFISRMLHALQPSPTPSSHAANRTNAGARPGGLEVRSPKPSDSDLVADADALIAHLARVYRRGDVSGLVRLFAPNAQVNEGRGLAFIRADYSGFFARVPERRLNIRRVRWRSSSDGRLVGIAEIRVATKGRDASSWRHLEGRMELELLQTPRGLKISKLLHTLSP
jgi:hypothetical protein